MSVQDRFIKYVKIDTTSDPASETFPSVPEKELPFADMMADELRAVGLSDVVRDVNGYVYATLPANLPAGDDESAHPVLGLISHMDTAPDAPGAGINPRIIEDYDGAPIPLGEGLVLDSENFASLKGHVGKKLIVTDGSTLLGGDDKAGVAEIVTACEYLLAHPEIHHGKIRVAFTPDEEVGRGVDFFDVPLFAADFAYTMDGGKLGEIEYENFNAAAGSVDIKGLSIHPGSAKGKMISAVEVAMEFQSLLPAFEKPQHTEGYEGFTHLISCEGTCDRAHLDYIIRDHDHALFEKKKAFLFTIADFLNKKYGDGTVTVTTADSYYNMKEKVEPYMFLIDLLKESCEELDIAPIVQPIRGGTDGARLSYMGLPCPNVGTGDYNCHGRFEYVCVDEMEGAVKLIVKLAEKFGKLSK